MSILVALWDEIGRYVIASGGGAVVAIAIFKLLGQKWLDAKFEERLARYKHLQERELEQLRFQISALLDRATRLSGREFEVLPDLWSSLNEAYWKVMAVTAPLQTYPDLRRMSADPLEEFFVSSGLSPAEQREVRDNADRQGRFIELSKWRQLSEANAVRMVSSTSIAKHRIFLAPEIKELFVEIDELIF